MTNPTPQPRIAARIGATLCDGLLALVCFVMTPILGSLFWWGLRFYFNLRDGRTLGKRLFRVQLVDAKTFAPPSLAQLLMRDLPFYTIQGIGLLPFLDIHLSNYIDDAGVYLLVLEGVVSIVTMSLPKTRGRTVYDLWSRTVVVGLQDADLYVVHEY